MGVKLWVEGTQVIEKKKLIAAAYGTVGTRSSSWQNGSEE